MYTLLISDMRYLHLIIFSEIPCTFTSAEELLRYCPIIVPRMENNNIMGDLKLDYKRHKDPGKKKLERCTVTLGLPTTKYSYLQMNAW